MATSIKCWVHQTGVPTHLQGKRWYAPGCSECEKKREAGKVSADDPPPWKARNKHLFGSDDYIAAEMRRRAVARGFTG